MINLPIADWETQLYGNRQPKEVFNLQSRRPNREAPPAPNNFQFVGNSSQYQIPGQTYQAFANPQMDHLTLAFDQAIQNLSSFLDSLTAPPGSPQSIQLGITGMNTVIVDYLNLLDACCASHPVLKSKLQMISQKLMSLQSTGSLPQTQTGPTFLFPQASRTVPNAASIYMPATPLLTTVPALAQHMPGYLGSLGITPPPVAQNRPLPNHLAYDPTRAPNPPYRMSGHHSNYPPPTYEMYPTNSSPPLNLHQNMIMNESLLPTPYMANKLNDAAVSSTNSQVL